MKEEETFALYYVTFEITVKIFPVLGIIHWEGGKEEMAVNWSWFCFPVLAHTLYTYCFIQEWLWHTHTLRHDSRRCAFLKQFCVYEWKKEGVNSYYLNDGKWICKAFDAYMKSEYLCNFVCSINIYYYYYNSFLRWHDFLYHKLPVVHNTFHTFRTFSSAVIACFSRDMSDSWLRAAAWWSSSSWIFRSASLSWCCASSLAVCNKKWNST